MQKIILFAHLPFDFALPFPIRLGYGVELVDSQPTLLILDPQVEALITPEKAAGLGQVHVCLRCNISGSELNADNRLWRALASMQLGGRLHWRATGAVNIQENAVLNAQCFRMETAGIGREKEFSKDEWEAIRIINVRITRTSAPGLERIRSVIMLWSQIACGKCSSWQLAVIGLIACIECCFPQPQPKNRSYDGLDYGKRLAGRVHRFLEPNGFKISDHKRLVRIYKTYRNSIAHGVHDPFIQGLKARRQSDFEFLFGVARLVVLGMLAFSNDELKTLLPKVAEAPSFQLALDNLGSARQNFLRNETLGKTD